MLLLLPGSQASLFLHSVEGICAPAAHKYPPHYEMSAPQARGKRSQSDLGGVLLVAFDKEKDDTILK